MKRSHGLWSAVLGAALSAAAATAEQPPAPQPRGYGIPIIDLDGETQRQVVVDREKGQYLGHPTTVLLDDGKTIIAVYPKGHGRGALVMKRSTDGGLTWSDRLPTPESWATSLEVPTLYPVVDAHGVKRLIMFSGLYPARMAVSEDQGKTWSELLPIGDWGGIVVMGDSVPLKEAGRYLAMFHDDGRFFSRGGKQGSPRIMTLYKTFSADGGLTWSKPEALFSRSDVHLCEPGVIRSPDGRQLAVLLRENARRRNSYVIFSDDEGRSFTDPVELPGALTGDRHQGLYAPDGRLLVSFRDTTHESPTQGDWVAWVGTYEDIVKGREGQYRIRLKDNKRGADCAYPALERLLDGTIIATTYGHWTEGEPPYILSVRFKLEEIDARARPHSDPSGGAAAGPQALGRPAMHDLFVGGEGGYHTYRIPAILVTQKGTVLAFCEGRSARGDHSHNDIVLRRSPDGGRTWTPLQVVAEDGEHCLLNPCAVQVRRSQRVLLMYQRYTWGFHVDKTVPGYEGERISRTFLTFSDDEGKNWSAPREITRFVKRPTEVTATPSGPGVGIQLRRGAYAGRILMPFVNQVPYPRRKVLAVYSDDEGETWHGGEYAPKGSAGDGAEVQMVELADGSVRLNARNAGGKLRKTAISTDGGQTWSPLLDVPDLVEPQCMGSILRYSDPLDGCRSRILFANPASEKARKNGTVRLSYDEGKTWPVAKVLYPGGYAYSSLAVLPDRRIGCLFEKDGYKTVTFARFTLEWLTDGQDSPESPLPAAAP